MVIVIDNYDSFTYNIVQILAQARDDVVVVRNDEVSADELEARHPTHLLVSPGPGTPAHAGISVAAIEQFAGRIPVLGVCLGHQALADAFGGRIIRASRLMHGKTSLIHHRGEGVFHGLPEPFSATRYHSLIVERESLPKTFEVTAWTEEGEIMGLKHRPSGAEGVQFHPESILSEAGEELLRGFLR